MVSNSPTEFIMVQITQLLIKLRILVGHVVLIINKSRNKKATA